MPGGHVAIPLAVETLHWVAAGAALALGVGLAQLVDHGLRRRGRQLADSLARGTRSPEVDTRLRFVRRLLYAAILVVGIALALAQFTGIDRIAASVLASGAIAAAVIGFAAQRTLANFVAGVMLAVTQPLRIGDWVHFDGDYGEVEDVRLNFTILRTPGGPRILIPNERLASGVLRNETLVAAAVAPEVTLWLPPGSDADRAVRALEEETGGTVSIAEVAADGIRLAVGAEPVDPPSRPAAEAELRARCLRRLRAEELLERG